MPVGELALSMFHAWTNLPDLNLLDIIPVSLFFPLNFLEVASQTLIDVMFRRMKKRIKNRTKERSKPSNINWNGHRTNKEYSELRTERSLWYCVAVIILTHYWALETWINTKQCSTHTRNDVRNYTCWWNKTTLLEICFSYRCLPVWCRMKNMIPRVTKTAHTRTWLVLTQCFRSES